MLCGGLAEDVAQPIFQIMLLVILIENNMAPIYAAVISTFFLMQLHVLAAWYVHDG